MPSLRTLHRLAKSVGLDLMIDVVPSLTREDRRSLSLHRRIADEVTRDPTGTIGKAKRNLRGMAQLHPEARALFRDWERILDQSPESVAESLVDPGPKYRELRQVTPFAGVLTAGERAQAYRQFREEEASS